MTTISVLKLDDGTITIVEKKAGVGLVETYHAKSWGVAILHLIENIRGDLEEGENSLLVQIVEVGRA